MEYLALIPIIGFTVLFFYPPATSLLIDYRIEEDRVTVVFLRRFVLLAYRLDRIKEIEILPLLRGLFTLYQVHFPNRLWGSRVMITPTRGIPLIITPSDSHGFIREVEARIAQLNRQSEMPHPHP